MPYNEDKTRFNGFKIFIKDGYECIDDGKFKYVHRLLMEEHLNRCLLKNEEIHHIDENKRHNEISNFKLYSKSNHSKKHGDATKFPSQIGNLNSQAKLSENDVLDIISRLKSEDDIQPLANQYRVHYVTIWGIFKNRTWKHLPRVAHR